MSTLTLTHAAARPRPHAVALALARREGLRLVRHPIVIVGALFSLAFFGLLTWELAPVLHRDDISTAAALLPFAAATLIAANLAATRSARDSTRELYGSLATTALVRTAAHLLSLAWVTGAAIGLVAVMLLYQFVGDPVGMPRLTELAVGPVAVALFGGIGVAVARFRSHVALGPVAVVVIVAIQVLLMQPFVAYEPIATRTPWLAPWVPLSLTGRVPPELMIRPSGWHLVYLLGLVALVVLGALLRQGPDRRFVAALSCAALLTTSGVVGQFRPPAASERIAVAALLERPEDFQVCRTRRSITYCAYRAYVPWIERWAKPIEAVLDELPASARPRGFTVRQTFGTYFEGAADVPPDVLRKMQRRDRRNDDVRTGFGWGRGAAEGRSELALALYVAVEGVGIPTERRDMVLTSEDVTMLRRTLLPQFPEHERARVEERVLKAGRRWESCHTRDQARAAVAIWLAGQATPGTRAAITDFAERFPYGLTIDREHRTVSYIGPFSPLFLPESPTGDFQRLQLSDAEFHYAARLLQRSDEETGSAMRARWNALTDRDTETDVLVRFLGLDPLPSFEEQLADLPDDIRRSAGEDAFGRPADYLIGVIPCR